MQMSVKATAKWSLFANAVKHPLVLETCYSEAAKRTGRARLGLLEIVAQAGLTSNPLFFLPSRFGSPSGPVFKEYLLLGHAPRSKNWKRLQPELRDIYVKAAEAIRQYLALVPSCKEMQERLRVAESQMKLAQLAELSIKSATKQAEEVAEARKAALACAELTEAASTYRTALVVREPSNEKLAARNYVVGVWQLDFNAPNRYHVTQAIWEEGRSVDLWDEWITIGSDHYEKIGFWVKLEDAPREGMNWLLLADKHLRILRGGDAVSARVFRSSDSRYVVLTYQPATLGELLRWGGLSEESNPFSNEKTQPPAGDRGDLQPINPNEWTGKPQLSIWIDLETRLLAKAVCDLEGKGPDGKDVHMQIEQVFAGFDQDLWVNPPEQE